MLPESLALTQKAKLLELEVCAEIFTLLSELYESEQVSHPNRNRIAQKQVSLRKGNLARIGMQHEFVPKHLGRYR